MYILLFLKKKIFIKFIDIIFFYHNLNIIVNYYSFTIIFNKLKYYFLLLNNKRKYFLKKYIYTINHKRIAINYFFFSMWSGLSGAALATMIRLELAYPGSPFFKGDSLRYLQVITAHGLIMVFFVVVPILFGGFANYLIPYHIGSKDVAFPRLNSIGFWILPCGFLLVAKIAFLRPQHWKYYDKTSFSDPFLKKLELAEKYDLIFSNNLLSTTFLKKYFDISNNFNWLERKKINYTNYSVYSFIPLKVLFWNFLVIFPESFWYAASRVVKARRRKVYVTKCSNRVLTAAGWTFITPFSSNIKYTGIGTQDILIISVIFAGISTTISFTNLLITRRTLAAEGFRNRKIILPFLTVSLLLTMRMLALITPVLGAAMIMLIMDRHWQTTFFEFTYGGDTILFQHLFWFFGHPEVYVLIIPTFGIINMVLPAHNTRRIASKGHLIWAIYIMAYMGFFVWGHHMYLVGLDHRSRSLYSTITIMISMPATIKVVNWTLTLLNGALNPDIAFFFAISYLLVFTVGGFTGMWLSHVGLNISLHDTFYVVAHFHLMLSGTTIIGCFTAFYFYFNSFFNLKCSRFFAIMHLIYYVGGQWLTFLPLFWVGVSGLPRRVHDYPAVFMGWQSMASAGHFITLLGVFFFFVMILDSHIERRVFTVLNLGLPRWHKRVAYYIFKIRYLQVSSRNLIILPNSNVRMYLAKPYCNEYEAIQSKL